MKKPTRIRCAALPQHIAKTLCLSGAHQYRFVDKATRRRLRTAHRSLLTFLLLFIAHCSMLTVTAATWSRQRSGTMAWLHAVQFLDQNQGWVAGSNGTLLETNDGGATWKRVSTLTKDSFRDVCFVDDHTGWLVAERDVYKLKTIDEARSYLLRTDDGGLTWRPVYLEGADANARIVRVMFANPANGWAFGETGVVFATSDGGAHWTLQTPPTKHLLLGGAFFDSSRLWLVGAGPSVIHTNNSGLTWQSGIVRDNVKFRFNSTSFVSDRLGWAVGSSGRIFATSDGGRTWSPQLSNVEVDLLDVKFINASEGWAAGADGTLLRTVNGGRHWFAETSGISHTLTRLYFVDRNNGWAVGFGGTILKLGPTSVPTLR